ncbi:sodium:calcium antiporter [Lentibacillus amyloliquefaciens]|uniref:Cation transporter n=1 Tax=Lentibacillus amyloliquefaciens TaxID=1472767 RepID=A0A0U4FWX6_9BACI|nr:sodium:calcium antiporter [Lentibacillus amyloliquefaciens]ALX50261.1 cation transporter [Lentibacillus amyloliquefaciens]
MVFVWFLLAAALTVYTALKLSVYADVISEKTAMGGMIVGTILLAGATSLPEVTTSFSAVIIDNIDIAVGNMLGSNLFNVFILAAFDLYYRRHRLFHLASSNHKYTALLGLLLMILVSAALIAGIDFTIFGIGADALVIMLVYIAGMAVISKMPSPEVTEQEAKAVTDGPAEKQDISIKHAVIGFIIAAIFILGAGTLLSITGDKIAVVTGMGSSFVGSFLIAATTSLPEGVSVFSALRLKNVNLAIGAILGSNMLNMFILAASDVVYQKGSIFTDGSGSHLLTAIGGSLLVAVIIWAFMRRRSPSLWSYSIPSIITVIGYFIVQYLIFHS